MKISTKDIILVALFAALTAIGGFVKIQVGTVPLTLQLFFCSFAGILLGARLGMLSQLVYVLIGLIGIPIFTQGGGPTYVLKPTFGFLIGFIIAAYVMGKIIEKAKTLNLTTIFIAVIVGFIVDYLIGIPYFYGIFNFVLSKPIAFMSAFKIMVPYMIKDAVLGVFVGLTAWKILPILRRSGLLPKTTK